MGHQARQAHQEDVPTSRQPPQKVFLCRDQRERLDVPETDFATARRLRAMIAGVTVRDEDLVSELGKARGFRRVEIAAALGDSDGEVGPSQLRRLLQEAGPGTSDLRCAALLALAKHCRDEAHDDYAAAFHSKDAGTRSYAVLALSAYGRDDLWEEVADRLVKTIKRRDRRGSAPSDVVLMIVYLARHTAKGSGRLPTLVGMVRQQWAGLDPRDEDEAKRWIDSYWPEAAPTGPPPDNVSAPDIAAMEMWVRKNPLFACLG